MVKLRLAIMTFVLLPWLASCGVGEQEASSPPELSRPNIIFVMSDDHAQRAISAYDNTLIQTPNIDRIAKEGMMFTDYYGEQSCTAGRSSYITGQSVFRTGLSKVGLPGAKEGMQEEDPTIAVFMKDLGYGKDYKYAHDFEGNFVDQEFMPEEIKGARLYEPGRNAREEQFRKFLKDRWKDKYGY